MKRNLILSTAVAIFMVATTVAQAADVSFSGQIRPRWNIDSIASDTAPANNPSHYFDTRVRLNAKVNVNANTEVFLQFQSTGVWGSAVANDDGSRLGIGGGSTDANDALDDVGFHQAYLTLKNFFGTTFDAKVGRQEVVIDGHRLFGHTGWTQGADSKDAIRLTHSAGNHTLNYTYIEGENNDSHTTHTTDQENIHLVHASTQGVLGGTLSGIFVLVNDDNQSAAMEDYMQWYTVGARQKGKVGGLDYRVEFYHQFGDAGAVANASGLSITGANATGASVDRDAQMFGIRVGKTFKNASMKPSITLWYDSLSGTDDDDSAGGDWGTFDVHHDTGHKFYGFMDFFLNGTGRGSGYYGLQDIAVKLKMSPRAGWTLKADFHNFRTQTDLEGDDADTLIAADAQMDTTMAGNDLGSELDLTLVHKYDANTKIAVGYSHYWTTGVFGALNGTGATGANGCTNAINACNDDADWAYVQIDTKF